MLQFQSQWIAPPFEVHGWDSGHQKIQVLSGQVAALGRWRFTRQKWLGRVNRPTGQPQMHIGCKLEVASKRWKRLGAGRRLQAPEGANPLYANLAGADLIKLQRS
jgi:hypothetical protein